MPVPTPVGRRRRARLSLLALSTILAAGVALPAQAQTVRRYVVDANGVDPVSGAYELSLPIGSIGTGATELPLVIQGRRRNNWTHAHAHQQVTPGAVLISITLDRGYDYFSSADGFARSTIGTGATLSVGSGGTVTYRRPDGISIVFGDPTGGVGPSPTICHNTSTTCDRAPIAVTRPGMPQVTYDWTVGQSCVQVTDPLNPFPGPEDPVEWQCTPRWRLGSVSNAAGYAIQFGYATDNENDEWWDLDVGATFVNTLAPAATPATVSYDPDYQLLTTASGATWQVTYDLANRVTGIRRPGESSDSTTIAHGANGVTSVTRDGVVTAYARSVAGSTVTTTATDATGHSTTTVSDLTSYRPVSVTDPYGHVTAYAYDAAGRLTDRTMPEGDVVHYGYDARSNVVEVRHKPKPGSALADAVATAGYDATCANQATCDRPNWTEDAGGHRTDYGYDATTGLVTSVTAPAPTPGAVRPQVRYSYTTAGGTSLLTGVSQCQTLAACAGGADEVKTTIAYDANQRPTAVTVGAGDGSLSATTGYGYDAAGDLTSVDGPLAGSDDTTTYRYDAERRPVGAISADPDGTGPQPPRASRTSYDAAGRPSLVEAGTVADAGDTAWAAFAPAQGVATVWDGDRRVLDTLVSGGTAYGRTQYGYDAAGRPQCTAVRMNPAAWASLPGACTAQSAGSDGPDRITRSAIGAGGTVTVSTAYGTPTQADEVTTFTANGQVASVTDGEGNRTGYAYDGLDRLSRTYFPVTTQGANASSTSDYEELGYDADGNVTSRRLRDGQVLYYGHDALGRLTLEDNPSTNLTEADIWHSYDLLGRLTQLRDANTWHNSYGYDALGRVRMASSLIGTNLLDYDAAGRLTRQQWADGFYVTYGYDVTGNVTTIQENGGTVLASFGYDALGRRTSVTRGNGATTSYAYDPVGRLNTLGHDLAGTAADLSVGYTYNPASQIATRVGSNDAYSWTGYGNTTSAQVVDGLNRLASVSGAGQSHDGRGNQVSANGLTLSYNTRDQLWGTGPGTMWYHGPNGLLGQEQGVGNLDWIGTHLATERDFTLTLINRRYVYAPGEDVPLVWYEGAGTGDKRWLHLDERGSVVAVSDGAGAALAINRYDEYGQPAAGNLGRFGYTGQQWIAGLGLWDYKARMYAPGLGRFLQTDPIGYGDGLNLYGYVGGDPVNRVDPLGLQDQPDIWAIGPSCPSGFFVMATQEGGDSHGYTCISLEVFPSSGMQGVGSGSILLGSGGARRGSPAQSSGATLPALPIGPVTGIARSARPADMMGLPPMSVRSCSALLSVGDVFLRAGEISNQIAVASAAVAVAGAPFTEGASLSMLGHSAELLALGSVFTLTGDIFGVAATGDPTRLTANTLSGAAKSFTTTHFGELAAEHAGGPMDDAIKNSHPYACR